MKIRYYERSDIDPAAWDACVAASTQRLLYGFSWYLDALLLEDTGSPANLVRDFGRSVPGWAGIVAEENGGYQAVMPIPFRRKYGLRYVQQPDFCQQLGLFSRSGTANKEVLPLFLRQLVRRFLRVISYRFNEGNEPELNLPAAIRQQRINLVLSLDHPYHRIYQEYSSDRKTNLNRARNAGWLIQESRDIHELIRLHRLYQEPKIIPGGRVDTSIYDRFGRAVAQTWARGLGRLLVARRGEGLPVEAGGLFVADANRIIYLFNGASVVGRKRQARLWMIDRLIEEGSGRWGEFDFESPAVGADSVGAYYRSFGARARAYSEIRY